MTPEPEPEPEPGSQLSIDDGVCSSDWLSVSYASEAASDNSTDTENNYAQLWEPSLPELFRWVSKALSANTATESAGNHKQVAVTAVSASAIQSLNLSYRNKDSRTNVLSFPSGMPVIPAVEESQSIEMLGDIVVCPEVLVKEASEQGKTLPDHWAHMVVHSVLHLTGLDHEDDAAAAAMEALEIQILSTLGVANPYKDTSANNHE